MTVAHAKQDVHVEEFIKDGDFDAYLTKFVITQPELNYVFRHRLGRVVRQIALVWTDEFLEWKVAKDAQGQPMSDKEKIVLNFNETRATIVLRFA
jgi:hypothetical protein